MEERGEGAVDIHGDVAILVAAGVGEGELEGDRAAGDGCIRHGEDELWLSDGDGDGDVCLETLRNLIDEVMGILRHDESAVALSLQDNGE